MKAGPHVTSRVADLSGSIWDKCTCINKKSKMNRHDIHGRVAGSPLLSRKKKQESIRLKVELKTGCLATIEAVLCGTVYLFVTSRPPSFVGVLCSGDNVIMSALTLFDLLKSRRQTVTTETLA